MDVSSHAGRLGGSAGRIVRAFRRDTEIWRANPGQKLSCDVNAVMSCSTVAESWQAEVVKFAGLSFPNAFFGIAAESVFVTIAVIGLTKVAVAPLGLRCAHGWWIGRAGLFVLADLAVVVCDQRAMPVVSVPDVLHTVQFMRCLMPRRWFRRFRPSARAYAPTTVLITI